MIHNVLCKYETIYTKYFDKKNNSFVLTAEKSYHYDWVMLKVGVTWDSKFVPVIMFCIEQFMASQILVTFLSWTYQVVFSYISVW